MQKHVAPALGGRPGTTSRRAESGEEAQALPADRKKVVQKLALCLELSTERGRASSKGNNDWEGRLGGRAVNQPR